MRTPETDPRSAKGQLLGMMRAAGRTADPIQARRAALGIFRSNLADLACSETELLAAFGKLYADLWTREPLPVAMFADLLAVHLAHGWTPDPATTDWQVLRRLQRADHARRLMQAETIPALKRAVEHQPDLARSGGEIDPAGALAWLRQYRPHLVPAIFSGVGQVQDGPWLKQDAPRASQDDVAKLVQERHRDVSDKDELHRIYNAEFKAEPSPLPRHTWIKRDAFRKMIPNHRTRR